jgi:ABC-type transport system substrate-binding protein
MNKTRHPHNPAATLAYKLVEKNNISKAKDVLAEAGYKDVDWQIESIKRFLVLQRRSNERTRARSRIYPKR